MHSDRFSAFFDALGAFTLLLDPAPRRVVARRLVRLYEPVELVGPNAAECASGRLLLSDRAVNLELITAYSSLRSRFIEGCNDWCSCRSAFAYAMLDWIDLIACEDHALAAYILITSRQTRNDAIAAFRRVGISERASSMNAVLADLEFMLLYAMPRRLTN